MRELYNRADIVSKIETNVWAGWASWRESANKFYRGIPGSRRLRGYPSAKPLLEVLECDLRYIDVSRWKSKDADRNE